MKVYLKRQLLVVPCIYLGQMLVGFGLGWTSPVIPKLQDISQTPLDHVVTDNQASWVATILYIGALVGPYLAVFVSNGFGRRRSLSIGGVCILISSILMIFTRNLVTILVVRAFMGFGLGIIFCINFVYIGEIASSNIRGILLTAVSVFTTFGTFFVYTVGAYISYTALGYVYFVLAALYVVGLFFVPDTPAYYISKDDEINAKRSLECLGRNDEANALKIIATEKKESDEPEYDLLEIFTIKSNRRALIITSVLSVCQHCSGIEAVIFFSTTIFKLAGSTIDPAVATIFIGMTQLVACCIAPLFVERSGRKILLIVSLTFCALSLAVLGGYFYMYQINEKSALKFGWLPLTCLVVYFFSYFTGFGSIPGTLIGEMFRYNVRTIGSSITNTLAWAVGFGVTTAFGSLVASLGGHVLFGCFSAACIFALVFTLTFVPETRGKSLLEIEEILSR